MALNFTKPFRAPNSKRLLQDFAKITLGANRSKWINWTYWSTGQIGSDQHRPRRGDAATPVHVASELVPWMKRRLWLRRIEEKSEKNEKVGSVDFMDLAWLAFLWFLVYVREPLYGPGTKTSRIIWTSCKLRKRKRGCCLAWRKTGKFSSTRRLKVLSLCSSVGTPAAVFGVSQLT